MRYQTESKPTIGFICTWPVYQGTTIDRYAHSLIQGISAAANEERCNLLLGCGFSITGNSQQDRSFWPVPGPDVNFVPNGRGIGIFYWDAVWTAVPGNGWDPADAISGNGWENQALFDYENRALPAMNLFNQP